MADLLPVVGVTKGTTNGAIATVDFNFQNAPGLYDPVATMLGKSLANDPAGFGVATIVREESSGARTLTVILEYPATNDAVVDALLRVLANILGYTMRLETAEHEMARRSAAGVIAAAEAALRGRSCREGDPGE